MDNNTVCYYITDIVLQSSVSCIVSCDGDINIPFMHEYSSSPAVRYEKNQMFPCLLTV